MTRVLALALPELAIDAVRRAAPRLVGRPLALVTTGKPGARRPAAKKRPAKKGKGTQTLRVAAASVEARRAGVRVGMTYAHALAVAPDLVVRDHAHADDDAALLGLLRWGMTTLSPRVAPAELHGRHALLVDATGLEPIHGDEAALLRVARAGLEALGFTSRGAIADTPLAALALAYHVPERGPERGPDRSPDCGPERDASSAPPGETRAALGPLPPRALPLDPAALDALARLGIDTLDGLLKLPRPGLPARLGEATLDVLDRALGLRDDPLVATPLPDVVRERLETVNDEQRGTDRLVDLAFALEVLAERVARRLDAEARGARALSLTLARDGARDVRSAFRLASPVSGARTLVRVLHRRLERQDLSVPVTSLALEVTETAPLVVQQEELFDVAAGARPASHEDLACLLARLEGTLGPRQVLRVDLVADHRPERAHTARPVSAPDAPPSTVARPAGPRPTRLLERPAPVGVDTHEGDAPRVLRQDHEAVALTDAVGPERIEAGFWDGPEAGRDYWVVAAEDGRAWWVFKELGTGGWFLHGVFD